MKAELKWYDGRIYHTGDERGIAGFCLRFKSGSFHYVGADVLKEAIDANFQIGFDARKYSRMPWGMQHSSYKFEEKPEWKENLIKNL